MNRISLFFDEFQKDFKSFDGVVISKRFMTPFIAIDVKGKVTNLESDDAIASYFQKFLDEYRSKKVDSCTYKELEVQKINESSFLATVSWELFNQAGDKVIGWRESYSIVDLNGSLKAFATYDH